MRYHGTFHRRIIHGGVELPSDILIVARAEAFLDSKTGEKYFNAYARPFKVGDSFLPFISCLGRHTEMPASAKAELVGRLNLNQKYLTLTDKIPSFLKTQDEISVVGSNFYFELWNPSHLNVLYGYYNSGGKE